MEPPKPRIIRGPSLNWSAEDIKRLSEVTPDDVFRAADWWRENAPRKHKSILDARPDRGDPISS